MGRRTDSDEGYVTQLCDELLGCIGIRQHRFPFLLGDVGRGGRRARLPVDVYYPHLNLVIEYWESQHMKPMAWWDGKKTMSGTRGEQRRLYDQRRVEVLEAHFITLIVIRYDDLSHDSRGRLRRLLQDDEQVLRSRLLKYLNQVSQ